MSTLNNVVLVGRLTKDPELRRLDKDLVTASFSLAIDNPFKTGKDKTASFIPCTVWNATAENLCKYCAKGSLIAIEGRLSQRTYTDKNEMARSVIEVVCNAIHFIDTKKTTNEAEDEDDEEEEKYPRKSSYNSKKR